MPDRPYTDVHSVIVSEIDNRFKCYEQSNKKEHEQTRKMVKENSEILRRVGDNKTHSIVNSVLISMLFIGMVLLFSGC